GAYLGHLRHPIELVLSTDDSQAGQEIRALAKDITDLSDKVSIREADSPRKPSFGIARVGEEPRVRFAAVPMGHEFTSLVLALLHVGGHPPKFSADELKRVEMLRGPLHFEVFMSLSCHNCP
ncbi:MAG: alkyl hydroperoxide reductase subunit F, partial [Tepidimonas ignava]